MSLRFFCCPLLIRNMFTEIFGYVFAWNFHVIIHGFAWPVLPVLCLIFWVLECSGHLGHSFIETLLENKNRPCWKTKILSYLDLKQGRFIYFSRKIMVKTHLICGASLLEILLLSSGTPKQFVTVKMMHEWKVCEVWDLGGCAPKQNTMDSDWEERLGKVGICLKSKSVIFFWNYPKKCGRNGG